MPKSSKSGPLNKRLKAAIIGCGNIAGGYDQPPPLAWSLTHAGGYYLCPDTELVAAADIDQGTLSAFGKKWGIARLYTDYRELLVKEKLDILSICLPTEMHYQAFKEALSSDIRAFIVEKPLSYRMEEAKELAALAEGKPVAVDYFRRWNPSFIKLKKEISDGQYGKIVKINAYYTKGLVHNASHGIDLLRYLIGEPGGGRCLSQIPLDAEDYPADFYLDFGEDIQAHFQVVPSCEYNIYEIDLLAARGRVLIAQRGQQIVRFEMVPESYYRKFNIIREKAVEETEWRNCILRAVEDVVQCLYHGGTPSCSIADGLRDLEISLALLESGRNNCRPFKL